MSKSEIAIRNGWFPRLLRALKLVEVSDDGQTTHVAGSDFIGTEPASQGYPAINSMSAMSAFPWVRACVEAISSDLTKVPLRVLRGRGRDAEPVEDHPILELLDRPSSRVPGILLRRQLIVDLVLTGDAYLLIAGKGEPRALIRLHPERVKIIPTQDGQPSEYEFNGGGSTVRYGFDQVLHIRLPSWQQTPTMLYGTGAIEALQHDLNTDLAAAKLAAESASTGLPTGIISPSEEGDRWSRQQISQLREGFEKQLRSKSGTVILGAGVDYKQLSQTLRDMEYENTRLLAREATLAAMGVPPSRVGLPNANYATAMAQSRLYWEGLQGRAALIDSEMTRLARMFPDSDDVRVVHDFSEVDALQESRTERVGRVQSWWLMGVDLAEAAALEGFDNLDVGQVSEAPPAEEPPPEAEQGLARWLVLDGKGEPETRDLESEEGRTAVWRGFIERVHGPNERKMALTMRRYLRAQASRIAKRLAKELGTKSITKGIDDRALDRILDEAYEGQQLLALFRPIYRDTIAKAFEEASRSIRADLTIDPDELDRQALLAVREMKGTILKTTQGQVRDIVNKGLAEDWTLDEMQRGLMQSATFAPHRAMAIARTETTRHSNRAAVDSFKKAEQTGLKIEKQWLSARDDRVRDSHRPQAAGGLDGQTVPVDGLFEHQGATAEHPGGFGDPAQDINCRCTVVAKVVN